MHFSILSFILTFIALAPVQVSALVPCRRDGNVTSEPQTPEEQGEIVTIDYDKALKLCDGAINCEVFYDNDMGMYLTRPKPGMEPGSQWYKENVEPYDTYDYSNKTSAEQERDFEEFMEDLINDEYGWMDGGDINGTMRNSTSLNKRADTDIWTWDEDDDEEEDYDDDEFAQYNDLTLRNGTFNATADAADEHHKHHKHHKHHHKHKHHKHNHNIRFSALRDKHNTNYGHTHPAKVIKKAEHMCRATGCIPGAHHTWEHQHFVSGHKRYEGTLELRVHGSFDPRGNNRGQMLHFIKAIATMAMKTGHRAKRVPYTYCPPQVGCEPPPACFTRILHHQYRSGTIFNIHRMVRAKGNNWAMGGTFVARIDMHVRKDTEVCAQVMSSLGFVVGGFPEVGAFGSGFFGSLATFLC